MHSEAMKRSKVKHNNSIMTINVSQGLIANETSFYASEKARAAS